MENREYNCDYKFNANTMTDEDAFEESLFSDAHTYLTDNDFSEFSNFEDELTDKDDELFDEVKEVSKWH
jgi:hypothetical protein